MHSIITFAVLAAVVHGRTNNGTKYIRASQYTWTRSALIYHNGNRNVDNWKRHLVRINDDGSYTRKWMFDHTILTSENEMGDIESGNSLNKLLQSFLQDAKDLDNAINNLKIPRDKRFQISIGCPYVRSDNGRTITLDGKDYHPTKMNERLGILKWYIRKVNDFRMSNNLQNSEIIGLYYHQEDAVDGQGDVPLIQGFNQYIHELGMKSVWVPYYNAPHGFEGRDKLGFDVDIVQPSYAFLSPIDGSVIKGDRLYSMASKSAEKQQCYEYEIRSAGGDTHEEYYIAHQYLAVAQETGIWQYPQAFFVGVTEDMFDRITSRSAAESFGHHVAWKSYTDLADYLEGKKIDNLEIMIPITRNNIKRVGVMDTWEITWRVPKSFEGLSSVRLDFKETCGGYWTGSVVVRIEKLDGTRGTSFSHRAGPDTTIPEYNSVFVPLADKNITEGTLLRITLQKHPKSAWPNIQRLVAAKYEITYIANPLYEEISTSSKPISPGPDHTDSVPSHKGYERGELTDGKLGPTDGWYWSGTVGWYRDQFSVSIDLERVVNVSKIQVWTHHDENSGVNIPVNIVGLVSSSCVPYLRGTIEYNCFPDGITAQQKTTVPNHPTSRLISLPFLDSVNARFVTISGIVRSWALLDEIQVFDSSNTIVSTGRPYKLNPVPGNIFSGPAYADNARRLVDGVVMSEWIYGQPFDGFNGGGFVETVWNTPKQAKYAIIWIAATYSSASVAVPTSVNIQWRNSANTWSGDNNVTPLTQEKCGPSPCAKLQLPFRAAVTGIRATFPSSSSWIMVSEISIM